ncbi:nucleotide sugar dehydrogenase [Thermoplasmatales archaeon SCGC AB-539-C06]|nr:nucleotide sugar dehydrogenase [Thermoplasmatales archaeon SCGC AB-539-C06]
MLLCVDIDKEKIKKINNSISPIYEDGLEDILLKYKKNIKATDDYNYAINNTEITFICVGTPSESDGGIDLSYVKEVTIKIAEVLKEKNDWHLVVVKSTVLPGTTRDIVLPLLEKRSGKKVGKEFGLAMNPEFLREGIAVNDFLRPDRIIIGTYSDKSKEILRELYEKFLCPLFETSLSAAEMIKYASNCFLATKISFMNEIGNFCKKLEIDSYEVADGMGLDNRIGRAFLDSGIGWGGSCFPKDLHALLAWAKKEKEKAKIIESVIELNDLQLSCLSNC